MFRGCRLNYLSNITCPKQKLQKPKQKLQKPIALGVES